MALYAKDKEFSTLFGATIGTGLKLTWQEIEQVHTIQADGDELSRACRILGRELPPTKVFHFFGSDVPTILFNWK